MAPPSPSPLFLTVVLTLLAMGVMSGVQAKPVGHPVPNLDITSSIKIDRPHFGETLGPFTVGQELTLTCSTEVSESVSLSWLEGDAEQESSGEENMGIISSSFTLQTLRLEDNRRRFTCRDEETLTTKTIELLVLPVPALDITTSLKMDQPIFRDTVGPFTTGQQLTLTCSAEASGSVSLSWWEGDTEQESLAHDAEGIISISFTIRTLRIEDNERRFTCRDEGTQTKKSIEIRINTDTLEIIKDGNPIEDGEILKVLAGEDFTINCIVQGYNPSAVSWWENDAELESVASKSPYARNSMLSLKALIVDDSRRSFTCRSLNGQMSKTVILDVEDTLEIIKDGNPIEDGEILKVLAGEDFTINCVVQGYNPGAVSWWEDDAELESVAFESPYARNSVLSLKALTVDDSRRSFTCRSLNGQLSKTVILDVEVHVSFFQEEYPLALALTIVVLVLLIAAVFVMVFFIIKTVNNKKVAKARSNTVLEESDFFSGGIVDNRLTIISRESKYGKLIESTPQSVSEYDEGPNAS